MEELEAFGVLTQVHDPLADPAEVAHEYGLTLTPPSELVPADAVVLAVPHKAFAALDWPGLTGLLKGGRGLVVDIKARLDRSAVPEGVALWRP